MKIIQRHTAHSKTIHFLDILFCLCHHELRPMSPSLKQNTHNPCWHQTYTLNFVCAVHHQLSWHENYARDLGNSQKRMTTTANNDDMMHVSKTERFPKRKWLFRMHPWCKRHCCRSKYFLVELREKQKVFRPTTIRQFRVSLMLLLLMLLIKPAFERVCTTQTVALAMRCDCDAVPLFQTIVLLINQIAVL